MIVTAKENTKFTCECGRTHSIVIYEHRSRCHHFDKNEWNKWGETVTCRCCQREVSIMYANEGLCPDCRGS